MMCGIRPKTKKTLKAALETWSRCGGVLAQMSKNRFVISGQFPRAKPKAIFYDPKPSGDFTAYTKKDAIKDLSREGKSSWAPLLKAVKRPKVK